MPAARGSRRLRAPGCRSRRAPALGEVERADRDRVVAERVRRRGRFGVELHPTSATRMPAQHNTANARCTNPNAHLLVRTHAGVGKESRTAKVVRRRVSGVNAVGTPAMRAGPGARSCAVRVTRSSPRAALRSLIAGMLAVRHGSVTGLEKSTFHAVNNLPGVFYPVLWPFQQLGRPPRRTAGRDRRGTSAPVSPRRALLVATVAKLGLERLVKSMVSRQRPGTSTRGHIHLRGDVSLRGESFVSGHAVLVTAIACLVAPVPPRTLEDRPVDRRRTRDGDARLRRRAQPARRDLRGRARPRDRRPAQSRLRRARHARTAPLLDVRRGRRASQCSSTGPLVYRVGGKHARLGPWMREAKLRGRDRTDLAGVDAVVAARARTAGGRAERRARRARRRRLRAARLLRLRHRDTRTSTGSPPAASGSRTSTRRRCAHRRARACSPAATTTPTAWPASPTSRSATPATRAASRARTSSCPEILARARVRGRTPSASGTSRPRTRRTWPRRRESWPLGRGFQRWYGFHGGETHQFVPSLYHDNHSVVAAALGRRRLPPHRRPRRPRHRVPRRPARGRRRAAVLPLLRDRRVPLAAPRARRVDRAVPRPLRRAVGTCGGSRPSPASWRWASLPAGTQAVAPPALGAGVGRPQARRPAGRGAVHGVLRRVPRARRRSRSAGCSTFVERARRARRHARHRSCPTTAPAPRAARRARSTTPRLWNGMRGRAARAARPHRRDRRPDRAQQLPVGLDDGGQHAVQALEARGARRRRRRSLHRALARTASRDRDDDPPPVRARDRRRADRARARSGIAAARVDRRARGLADRGHELRLPARRRRRRRAAHARSTSRCSAAAGSTTTDGRR